jgi:hypothetical protein
MFVGSARREHSSEEGESVGKTHHAPLAWVFGVSVTSSYQILSAGGRIHVIKLSCGHGTSLNVIFVVNQSQYLLLVTVKAILSADWYLVADFCQTTLSF